MKKKHLKFIVLYESYRLVKLPMFYIKEEKKLCIYIYVVREMFKHEL